MNKSQKTAWLIGFVGVLLALLPCHKVRAGVLISSNDWDYRPLANNWTDQYDAAVITVAGTGGNTGKYLQVQFTDVVDFTTSNEVEIVAAPATNFLVGTPFVENMYVSFDFWSSNTTPDGLKLVFQSSANDSYWSYAFSPETSTGWVSYTAMFSTNGWVSSDPGQTPEQFLADLQSVSWIGVYIDRDTRDQEFYGIDNFMLWVPEPGEWAMILLAILLSLAANRRRAAQEARYGLAGCSTSAPVAVAG